jgi:UDP-N-acetyl-D-glucosamine dehydrogenase
VTQTDVSYILAATQQVKAHLHSDQIIVLESTTYPGTSDEVMLPDFVANKINDALNEQRRCLNGATVLVLGVAYKKNVGDLRESPALEVLQELVERKANVLYNDDYVPSLALKDRRLFSQPLSDGLLQAADCVVIVTDHDYYDATQIVNQARSVVDSRNMTQDNPNPKILRL